MPHDSATDPTPDQTPEAAPRAPREPIINAPLIVILTALALVGLYAAYSFAPSDEQQSILYNFALAPERFWAPAGSFKVYPDVTSGLLTLASTGLLHYDWMHVLVNSGMLLALGTPVARALGNDVTGWGLWMLVFVAAVVGGSALYLALTTVTSPPAVGASGGVSGLFAAAFLLDEWGMKRKPWAPEFVRMTLGFALANAVLYFMAPYLIGTGIAWEAHAGGYIAGALLMAVLPVRGYRGARL